ncbi:hypothetical protein CAPTEDRAFT_202053 [Capitella teleta]|uniref:Neurotransmitter-gated ion-channel ligand-binding domain-containing protein n=1 Tax=Capitella teleta TaxID=283909 RepID=R7TB42_CAPTE|nr:hypothetical protein CAPTEDRAFT_202053 [Capitella teleta]|eukprot:ELT88707.1 hypothetical protein CAPTEDRAFT_202053 [Capitella teleta]
MFICCLIILITTSSLIHGAPIDSTNSENLNSSLHCPSCGVMKLGPMPLYSDPNCDDLTDIEGVDWTVCPHPPPNHVSTCIAIQGSSDGVLLSTKTTVRDCFNLPESDPRVLGGCRAATALDLDVKLLVADFWREREMNYIAGGYNENWEGRVCYGSALGKIVQKLASKSVYCDLTYEIVLRRRPVYFARFMLLPIIILSCLVLVIFWIPPQRTDRTGLGMSLFASFMFLLLLVVDITPPTDDSKLGESCPMRGFCARNERMILDIILILRFRFTNCCEFCRLLQL